MSSVTEAIRPLERVRPIAETYDRDFAEHRAYLTGVCRSLVGDDAEDVVQDAYLAGRHRLSQLREAALLRPWLTSIAVNLCYDRHRRRQRLAAILATVTPRQPKAPDLDLRARLEALPFRDRTILVLQYGHGLALEEIARLLGLKPVTVRSIAFRARQRLRKELGDAHAFDEGGSR